MDSPTHRDTVPTQPSQQLTHDLHALFLNLDPDLWIILLEIAVFDANSGQDFGEAYLPILKVFPEINSVPILKEWREQKVSDIQYRSEEVEFDPWIVGCSDEQYFEQYADFYIMHKTLIIGIAELSAKTKRKFGH